MDTHISQLMHSDSHHLMLPPDLTISLVLTTLGDKTKDFDFVHKTFSTGGAHGHMTSRVLLLWYVLMNAL